MSLHFLVLKVDIQELEKDLSSQLAAARCLVANLDMPTNRRQSVLDVHVFRVWILYLNLGASGPGNSKASSTKNLKNFLRI